jgi:hypothetical protein
LWKIFFMIEVFPERLLPRTTMFILVLIDLFEENYLIIFLVG